MLKKALIISFVLFVTGCGGDSDTTADTLEVNLLGTWDYGLITQNAVCDGLIAKGTLTVQSLNGDLTKIGDVLSQGEGFDISSFGSCVFKVVDNISTDNRGEPAVQTANQYLALINEANLGDNTIKSVRIDSFTDHKIIEVKEYTNGVIYTLIYTR